MEPPFTLVVPHDWRKRPRMRRFVHMLCPETWIDEKRTKKPKVCPYCGQKQNNKGEVK